MYNSNFDEIDEEHFYFLFMNIRKMYNLIKTKKNDRDAKYYTYDYILDDVTDMMFFQEQLKYRHLTMKDCFIDY